jgi:hypothetical protein
LTAEEKQATVRDLLSARSGVYWEGPFAIGAYRAAYTGLGAIGQQITVIPLLDLVVAHKTVPDGGKSVSHQQYLDVLDVLLRADCRRTGKCS